MRFDILLEIRVAAVLPVLLRPKLGTRPFLYPVRNEEILVLPRFGIINFWKVPLVRVSARDVEIQETFLCWLSYPVHSVIYADLGLVLAASAIIDAEAYSLKLPIFLIVTTLIGRLLLWSVILDELRLKKLIDLLLFLLPLLSFPVIIVMFPGPTNKVLVQETLR